MRAGGRCVVCLVVCTIGSTSAYGAETEVQRHGASMRIWGRALTVFQHSYVIHTGQAPVPVYHTVYVTNAPDWPGLTVAPRGLVGRLLYRLGRRPDVLLENETFNALRKV